MSKKSTDKSKDKSIAIVKDKETSASADLDTNAFNSFSIGNKNPTRSKSDLNLKNLPAIKQQQNVKRAESPPVRKEPDPAKSMSKKSETSKTVVKEEPAKPKRPVAEKPMRNSVKKEPPKDTKYPNVDSADFNKEPKAMQGHSEFLAWIMNGKTDDLWDSEQLLFKSK